MEELFRDWLGVGSVMRHFLSWSWPELHRRIICPAGFLLYTILETTIYTITYYRIPVHSIHETSPRYRNTSTDYETFLPPLRPEEKCNQFLQPQPTRALLSQTPITHNCSVTETSGWRWTMINQKYGDIQLISLIKYSVSRITFPKQSEKFILPVISKYFYQKYLTFQIRTLLGPVWNEVPPFWEPSQIKRGFVIWPLLVGCSGWGWDRSKDADDEMLKPLRLTPWLASPLAPLTQNSAGRRLLVLIRLPTITINNSSPPYTF